jgi:adenylate cyclase
MTEPTLKPADGVAPIRDDPTRGEELRTDLRRAGTPGAPQGQSARVRQVRLLSGLVLLFFVATHLLNHSLGLFSLAAMEQGREVFLAFWRAPVVALVLLAAIVTHLALALWSIYQRRHLRMPAWEAVQLGLGLVIPYFLLDHAIATGAANAQFGYQDSYTMLVLLYWELRPDIGAYQTVLVILAWLHGCIGVHFWLRFRRGYASLRMGLYTLALLLPVLALLGFAQAGRFVSTLAADPEWVQQTKAAARIPDARAAAVLERQGTLIENTLLALLAFTLVARAVRRRVEGRRSVQVTYPGRRVVSVPIGFSVLESSRHAGIAHASVCGGRGRCSTCRVRVTQGKEDLPAPSAEEARVLARVGASPDVRLACQLRPVRNLSVLPLIPPSVRPQSALAPAGVDARVMTGEEREICVLFADLRGFTRMAESRLPYDVVFLLNRYFEAMGEAIERAGGIPNQFTGDGVMALFGVTSGPQRGAREALVAARDMQQALARLSADLHEELPESLRLGIGIHSGSTVVGHMGRGVATYLTAVGDTVNTASRLQDQTKHFACQLIVSDAVAKLAGLDVSACQHEEITVRNRAEPIAIHIIKDVEAVALPPVGTERKA